MKLEFISWTLIFLLIAGQGLLLTYIISSRPNLNKISSRSLSSTILVFSVMLLFWVGFWNDITNQNIIYDLLYYPIPFLLGPLFYNYISKAINEESNNSSLHLFPFLITLFFSIIAFIYWTFTDTLLIEKTISDFIIYQLHTISFLVYSLISFLLIHRKYGIIKSRFSNISSLNLVRISVLFFGLFSIISFTNFFFNRVLDIIIFLDLGLAIISCVFIYSIGYMGLKQLTVAATEKKIIGQYSKSSLKPQYADDMMKTIISYMEEENPYLQLNFRIKDLVNATQIPSHHISELLNKYYNQNFSEFTNSYRIKEAIKILSSQDANYKISAVAYDVGFNSETTLYTWFKKITGLSPRLYQQKKAPK